MKAVWALARKELRLILRDRLAASLLLGMPLLFILVLGLLLGENFGRKADDSLRISLVDLDEGKGLDGQSWAHWVLTDLQETPGIRIEVIPSKAEAEALVRSHRRAAILVLDGDFSERINRCSFLDTPGSMNPFHREGVYLRQVHANMLKDGTQDGAASIIEQVVQVTMLRVILPYMIGQAFEKLSEPRFIKRLGEEVKLPMPQDFKTLLGGAERLLRRPDVALARRFDPKLNAELAKMDAKMKEFKPLMEEKRIRLSQMIDLASGNDPARKQVFEAKVGEGVQKALEKQFIKYNLTGMTWAALTKSRSSEGRRGEVQAYEEREGSGLLKRGAYRYQILVPSYTVMFSFFLVLTVGWLFVSERRQGTLKRLRSAPLSRAQILLGKLLPCYLVSVGQGVFLLTAGRLLFGMRWGPETWPLAEQAGWLLLVVLCTSLAAMGLALLVAALAQTEMQVALYGAVPVLVLALVGGCVLPREMMPEQTQKLSLLTPQGWALDAYRELLTPTAGYQPNLAIVLTACGVLAAFGCVFLAAAWGLLRLE
jgi:ABC-type multidrug transport system permease subunit